jgi:hypothetical protein
MGKIYEPNTTKIISTFIRRITHVATSGELVTNRYTDRVDSIGYEIMKSKYEVTYFTVYF